MTEQELELLFSGASDGDMTGEEQERLVGVAREAIAHRDDYETRCIEQGIKIRGLERELLNAYRQRDAMRKLSKAQDCLLACYRTDANPGRTAQAMERVENCREAANRLLEGQDNEAPDEATVPDVGWRSSVEISAFLSSRRGIEISPTEVAEELKFLQQIGAAQAMDGVWRPNPE